MLSLAGWAVGCVGVAGVVRGTGTYAFQSPALSTRTGARPPTAPNVRAALGEPDSVEPLDEHRERWRYRTGLRWHGLGLLLIVVPVPLMIPTGCNHAEVTFHDGRAVFVRGRANTELAAFGCLWGNLPFARRMNTCFADGYEAPPAELRRDGSALWAGPGLQGSEE